MLYHFFSLIEEIIENFYIFKIILQVEIANENFQIINILLNNFKLKFFNKIMGHADCIYNYYYKNF